MANTWAQAWKGTITINSNDFNALQFDYEEFGDLEDITFSQVGSATFRAVLPGYPGVRGTVTFVYDTLNQPTISPFDFRFGTLATIVIKPEGTKPFSFTAYTGNFKFSSGPQAGVSVKCTTNFESTSALVRPTS